MGRKNLSKRRKYSKRRGNKYRNSKRWYYKRRTNRNTKKRTNKFKNSNRKLKKFIGGGAIEIIIDVDSITANERDDMDSIGNYIRKIYSYTLVFKYDDNELLLVLPVIINKSKTELTSVRDSVVSYFNSFKGDNGVVKSLQHYDITYKYYFRMKAGNKVELKENNTIDIDIKASEINALIIEINYEEMSSVDDKPERVFTMNHDASADLVN